MTTQILRSVFYAAAFMFAFTTAGAAHHSFAGQFDNTKSMEIEGELIEVRWANPHASVPESSASI